MTAANRPVVIMLVAAVLAAAFWFVALAPKRDRAGELSHQVQDAQAAVDTQKQAIAAGVEARRGFSGDYQQLVVLGKAVPEGDDTGSLLVELSKIASNSGVEFRQLRLAESTEAASAPTPPPAPAAPTATEPLPEPGTTDTSTTSSDTSTTSSDSSTTSSDSSSTSSTATTTATPAPATEGAAATLPLGASVGAAGLAVMPYELQFEGDFFEIADFLAGVDRLVETKTGNVAVDGRLMTVDGFSLSQNTGKGFPSLEVNLLITTYVTPPGQGLTAGASPTAPAPTGTVDATTTSTTTTTSSP